MPGTAVSDMKLGFFLFFGFLAAAILLAVVMGVFGGK